MNIGERIYKLRKENNLSQEQLAERLEISRQSISKWESGQSVPELEKIIQLSELFDVTTDYLLKSKEVKNHNHVSGENNGPAAKGSSFYAILSTGITLMGLVAMMTLSNIWYAGLAVGTGLVIQIIGVVIFEMAAYSQKAADGSNYAVAHIKYYALNNWFLLYIPICYLAVPYFNFLKMPFRFYGKYYLAICTLVTCLLMGILFIKKRKIITSRGARV